MRRHVFAAIVIAVLAIIESSLLPSAFGTFPRPNLVLVVSSTWAAIRGDEGFLWAAWGGFLLDALSSAPFGIYFFGLMLGNLVALALDRAPLPVAVLRAVFWVVVTSIVSYGVALIVLAFSQRPFDIPYGLTTIVAPSVIFNAILAVPAYIILNRVQQRLREQERFLSER
jgi:rod shape-determining protein MreD